MSYNHYGRPASEVRDAFESHRRGVSDRHARNRAVGCDEDNFTGLSAWGEQQTTDLYLAEIALAEAGWVAYFPFLATLDGEGTHAPLILGRYGPAWKVDAGGGDVSWVSYGLKPGNLAKRGYREEWRPLPAFADHEGGGRGMSGVLDVRVAITPHWDDAGIERDARSGLGRMSPDGDG